MYHPRRSLGASGVTNVSPSQESRSKRRDECVTAACIRSPPRSEERKVAVGSEVGGSIDQSDAGSAGIFSRRTTRKIQPEAKPPIESLRGPTPR
eukprot:1375629-Pyramimonas_sp.AAC.1